MQKNPTGRVTGTFTRMDQQFEKQQPIFIDRLLLFTL